MKRFILLCSLYFMAGCCSSTAEKYKVIPTQAVAYLDGGTLQFSGFYATGNQDYQSYNFFRTPPDPFSGDLKPETIYIGKWRSELRNTYLIANSKEEALFWRLLEAYQSQHKQNISLLKVLNTLDYDENTNGDNDLLNLLNEAGDSTKNLSEMLIELEERVIPSQK